MDASLCHLGTAVGYFECDGVTRGHRHMVQARQRLGVSVIPGSRGQAAGAIACSLPAMHRSRPRRSR